MEKSVIASNGIAMAGEISVIRVKGYLDVVTSEELDAAIEDLVAASRYNIIIDLNEVDYISSMGWGLFLSRINDLRMRGGDLKLARMQMNVYEVFKVLEFEWFLNTYPTLEAAAMAFALNGNGVNHTQHSTSRA